MFEKKLSVCFFDLVVFYLEFHDESFQVLDSFDSFKLSLIKICSQIADLRVRLAWCFRNRTYSACIRLVSFTSELECVYSFIDEIADF